ncbi:hypothetical protein LPJ61_000652 [Coemansia biformis]|uniref:Uncharacterized protein n=1 Tax=Coemansia biformis TaxID=1286918 RepID=A0A9W7YI99_9FUNG|nr:hypothetical protein LPJ61_000652 [Coemansia biformis]
MRLLGLPLGSVALAAALLGALTGATPLALLGPTGKTIVGWDAKQACLSPKANRISADNRLALYNLASDLQSTTFSDIRSFAPAARALNQTAIEQHITANNFPAAVNGLVELKSYLATFPEISSPAGKACRAPTAKSLRAIYANLSEFVAELS